MEGTIAQVLLFAGNFAPRAWAFCQGQLLSIASNTALFSIIGTMYGGDGRSTFALPNFQGRIPIGAGQGPGLPNYTIGEVTGSETVTLTTANLPAHNHAATAQVAVSNNNATLDEANGNVYAGTAGDTFASATGATGALSGVTATLTAAGNNQPINIMEPYLAMNFVICLQGIFPVRN